MSLTQPDPVKPEMVNAVAVKLVPFDMDDLDGWFSEAEVQFGMRSILADDMKFQHVCTAMDAETSSRGTRAFWNVGTGKKYKVVKFFSPL